MERRLPASHPVWGSSTGGCTETPASLPTPQRPRAFPHSHPQRGKPRPGLGPTAGQGSTGAAAQRSLHHPQRHAVRFQVSAVIPTAHALPGLSGPGWPTGDRAAPTLLPERGTDPENGSRLLTPQHLPNTGLQQLLRTEEGTGGSIRLSGEGGAASHHGEGAGSLPTGRQLLLRWL